MQKVSAHHFVQYLENQTLKSLQDGAVEEYFESRSFDPRAFDAFTFFCDSDPARNLVAKKKHFELLVVSWLPLQETPVHDHGNQKCWMWIQSGELISRNFKLKKNGELQEIGTEVLKSGMQSYIDDSVGLHSLVNASTKPAVSIHLYASPISICRVYQAEKACFEEIELDYFTQYGKAPHPFPLNA